MGKIRVSALGDQDAEKKQKDEAQKRRLAKKVAKEGTKAETAALEKKETKKESKNSSSARASEDKQGVESKKDEKKEEVKEQKKVVSKPKQNAPHVRGKRYKDLRKLVDPRKVYPLAEGLVLVKQTANTKFTGTIEAHFNLTRVVKVKNVDGVKVERKTPLAHAKLGKTTDTESTLKTKLEQITKALGAPNIKKVVLNASMGPGIKVNL